MYAAFITGEALGRVLAHLKRGRKGTFSSVNRWKPRQSANQYWFPENSSAGEKIMADNAPHSSFLITRRSALLSIANTLVAPLLAPVLVVSKSIIRHVIWAQPPVKPFLHDLIPSLSLSKKQGYKCLQFTCLDTEVYGHCFLGFWLRSSMERFTVLAQATWPVKAGLAFKRNLL